MRIKQATSSILLVAFFLLAGCSQEPLSKPTTVPALPSTVTSTPFLTNAVTQTSLPTPTITHTPTKIPFTTTPTISPGTVTGIVSLNNGEAQPLTTSVELREPQTFILIRSLESDLSGAFTFGELLPGKYEVWILLNDRPIPIEGCSDVFPQNIKWKIGIKFGEGKAVTIENTSLGRVILLIEELKSSDLIATGIYGVVEIDVVSSIGNYVDATFICR